MDWESWWEVERLAVDLLANSADLAAVALGRLRTVVDRVAVWQPGTGLLTDHVRECFTRAPAVAASLLDVTAWCGEALGAIPPGLEPSVPSRRSPPDDGLKRFLAAHAFANWIAHLGPGLHAWMRSIEMAYALIASGWDVRQTDLVLRHLADPWSLASTPGPRAGRVRRAGPSNRSSARR